MLRCKTKSTSSHAPVAEALEDAGKSTVRAAIDAFISGASEGVLYIGSATPFVGPVFVVLKEAYAQVQTAKSNKHDLQELTGLCQKIAVNVTDQQTWDTQVAPPGLRDLLKLVEEVRDLAMHYNGRKFWMRLLGSHKDKTEFDGLRARINQLIPVLGLSATLQSTKVFSNQMEELRQTMISTVHAERVDIRQAAKIHQKDFDILSRVASAIDVSLDAVEANTEQTLMLLRSMASQSIPAKPKSLAPKPKGLPVAEHWYVERKDKVERVINALCVVDHDTTFSARVVGLLGPSGAGKTTVAAAVARSKEIRERFSDGVLWIPVGEGTKDQLDTFVLRLAKMVYDHVAHRKGRPPPDSLFQYPELGASYVKKIVEEHDRVLQCLLVADNVWETEVVDLLRQTGLWVLVTTRKLDVTGEGTEAMVDVRRMSELEAERLLRLAAKLDGDEPLPHAAYDIIERCDYLAMDLAFVGRWSDVRGRSDQHAWESILDSILRQDAAIEKEIASRQTSIEMGQNACRTKERRHAILRAGYEEIQDKRHRRLYMLLAVFPKGFKFSANDIAVLLHNRDSPGGSVAGMEERKRSEEEAKALAESLEGWAVLVRERNNRYSLHDTHADFVKHSIANFPDLRRQCVSRWCGHLSTLDVVRLCDCRILQGLFRAAETLRDDGEGRVTRDNDTDVAAQDNEDSQHLERLGETSFPYLIEGDYEALRIEEASLRRDRPAISRTLHDLGSRTANVREIAEAAELLRHVLHVREVTLDMDHPDITHTLLELGRCAMRLLVTAEAEKTFNRALDIRVKKLEDEHPHVAVVPNALVEYGQTDDARVEEAEKIPQRSYGILQTSNVPQCDIEATLTSLPEPKRRQNSSGRFIPAKLMSLFEALAALIVMVLCLVTFH